MSGFAIDGLDELADADLERVAGGKDAKDAFMRAADRAESAFASLDRAARDVGGASKQVAGSAERLAKSFGVN